MSFSLNGVWDTVIGFGKSVENLVLRHKKKIIVLGLIGGTFYMGKELINYNRDQVEKYQQFDYLVRAKKTLQDFYLKTQKKSDETIINYVPMLKEKLESLIEIPLSNAKASSTKEKVQVFETIKFQTFTRVISGIYSVSLLVLFLKVIINILARNMYIDSLPDDSEYPSEVVEPEIQKKYIQLIDYFLHDGLKDLVAFMQGKVQAEMAQWPVTRKYSMEELSNMLKNIRDRIENPSKFPDELAQVRFAAQKFLLPPEGKDHGESLLINCLINETRDIIESEEFITVLSMCLGKAFDLVLVELSQSVTSLMSEEDTSYLEFPMPKVLPLLKKQFSSLLSTEELGLKDTFLQFLLYSQDLSAYSYSVFAVDEY